MQVLMIASILLSTIVGTVVGVKLLRLASATRQFPEFAIGGALVCYAAIAQTSLFVTHAVGEDAPHAIRMVLLGVRLFAFYLTLLGLSAFTWRVFGVESRWRLGLAVLVAVTAIGTMGASFWATWHEVLVEGGIPAYARFGASPQFALAFGWMSVESLRYRQLMRKREALGLADPVLANRFGVWGVSAAASSLLVIALTIVMIRSDGALLGADPLSSAIVSAAGLVNAFGWWLTFMPPAAYTNWVARQP